MGETGDRLDSWKEIAGFLGRDVTTAQRWERREGLPVHRHRHDRQGTVYASKAELAEWLRARTVPAERNTQDAPPDPAPSIEASPPERVTRSRVWLAGGAAVVALLAWTARHAPVPASGEPARSSVVLPPRGQHFGRFAIAPDGDRLVAVGIDGASRHALWLRVTRSTRLSRLAGAEGASQPFWSPDGEKIGFFANGALKTLALRSGDIRTVCVIHGPQGAVWTPSGVIVVGSETGLMRVPDTGGPPAPLTTLIASADERAHQDPALLPDGRHVLFLADAEELAHHTISVVDLETGERRDLLRGVMSAAFYQDGYLVYGLNGDLVARSLDAATLTLTGPEFVAVRGFEQAHGGHAGLFAVSGHTLGYRNVGERESQLTWFDRNGRSLETLGPPGEYQMPVIAPYGNRVAVGRFDPQTRSTNLWLFDDAAPLGRPLTNEGYVDSPVWSPDGRSIAFTAQRDDHFTIETIDPDHPTRRATVIPAATDLTTLDWASSRGLLFSRRDRLESESALWIRPSDAQPPRRYRGMGTENPVARFSPDGDLVVYVNVEGRMHKIFIARSENLNERRQVSQEEAFGPRFSPDGRTLFYTRHDGALMMLPLVLHAGGLPDLGSPTEFVRLPPSPGNMPDYDVGRDGRILLNVLTGDDSTGGILLIENWTARAPAR